MCMCMIVCFVYFSTESFLSHCFIIMQLTLPTHHLRGLTFPPFLEDTRLPQLKKESSYFLVYHLIGQASFLQDGSAREGQVLTLEPAGHGQWVKLMTNMCYIHEKWMTSLLILFQTLTYTSIGSLRWTIRDNFGKQNSY